MGQFNGNNFAIGIDIERVKRFEKLNKTNPLINGIFSKEEVDYCFSKKFYAQHLAARYCAKEALVKAFCSLGFEQFQYADFEIKKCQNGAPIIKVLNYHDLTTEEINNFKIEVSLSHTKDNAIAQVFVIKE